MIGINRYLKFINDKNENNALIKKRSGISMFPEIREAFLKIREVFPNITANFVTIELSRKNKEK